MASDSSRSSEWPGCARHDARVVAIRRATTDDVAALVALHLDTVLHAYRDWFPSDAVPPDPVALTRLWTDDELGVREVRYELVLG